MYLYAANDVPDYYLESDDDSGNGYFSLLEMSGLEQGDYYVDVEAYEGLWLRARYRSTPSSS